MTTCQSELTLTSWRESTHVAEACARMLLGHRLGRLLDAGGGEGFVTAYLMRNRVVDDAVVLDRDEKLLAKVPPPIQTKKGSVEQLNEFDGEFSTILVRQVLHYVESPVVALRRIGARLRPDGALYVGQLMAPNPAAARWLGDAGGWLSPTRRRVWTVNHMLTTLASAGLILENAAVMPQRLPVAQRMLADPVGRGDRRGRDAPDHALHTSLRVRVDDGGTVTCRVYWLHALLRTGGNADSSCQCVWPPTRPPKPATRASDRH